MTEYPIIVGMGASAGGINAFHTFFRKMPLDSGMAFVVILHLPGGRKSLLPEILGRWTAMPVVEVTDSAVIRPNHIYVPVPQTIMTIENGRLRTREPDLDAPKELRPIDAFFDCLAASMRENAVGIVMSGTGSDGALGLKAIKEYGGLTIAQGADGSGPEYDEMPAGAIATGAVDLVLPVEAIPSHLRRFKPAKAEGAPEDTDTARLAVCALLRAEIGHDFSGYRDKTFMRRVRRRMQVLGIDNVDEYVARLQIDHDEAIQLFRDLLIRVTSFFRDAEAFEALERLVMPRLFADKRADGTIRVWVPGCATGEEAYSLAILLREQMDRLRGTPKVQVFATDIDDAAVATARLGRYPTTLLEGLSPQRRERFFRASPSGYVVTKEIRDLCTFSSRSIVRDAPFSKMDLISCRNLLIYMDTDLQASVIPNFHYSLVPGGILLLGISESTSRHEELFAPLDKAHRIFIRRDVPSPPLKIRPKDREITLAHASGTARQPFFSLSPNSSSQAGYDAKSHGSRPDSIDLSAPPGKPHWLKHTLGTGLIRLAAWFSPNEPTAQHLRIGLLRTREQLQSLAEEHETALEELRSTNEELHSVNEELQSSNEELETSKEELQSINEELHTVNNRLSEKIDQLDQSNSDLKNLFDSTEVATIFLDCNFIIRSFTPAVGTIYNLIPSDQGRPLTDIVSRLRYPDLRTDVRRVADKLEPLERRVEHEDGRTHYMMRILPYRAPDSSVSGTLITFVDVTTIVRAEQHQRLLVDELNHRVKNMLAVVISLADQTLRRSTTLKQFSEAFLGRVRAMTASYELLSNQHWVSVSLRDILAEETKPFAGTQGSNITLEGPDIRLTAAGALALGIVIHELATNAVKYGSLSVPEGIVSLTWGFAEDELVLRWTEKNGPPVHAPTKRGFGMTLIERGFAHELGGQAELDFHIDGVRATLRAPAGAAVVTGSGF